VDKMNLKRVVIATVIGLARGLFCAHGTMMMAERREAAFIIADVVATKLS
jgi:hypothetical protein